MSTPSHRLAAASLAAAARSPSLASKRALASSAASSRAWLAPCPLNGAIGCAASPMRVVHEASPECISSREMAPSLLRVVTLASSGAPGPCVGGARDGVGGAPSGARGMAVRSEAADAVEAGGVPAGVGARYGAPKEAGGARDGAPYGGGGTGSARCGAPSGGAGTGARDGAAPVALSYGLSYGVSRS